MDLFKVFTTFVLMYLFVISGAQPVHRGHKKIHHRLRRQDKLITTTFSSRPRRCSHYSGHTSTSDVSLLYKNGWFLAVFDDGNINGTSDARSLDIKLQLRSVGSSMVRMYSTRSCLYIAMSSAGKVYTTERPTNETVFKQTHEPNGFYTFASHQHQHEGKPMFLSMRKTGHMKNGIKTSRNHRTTLLTVVAEIDPF